MIKFLLGLFSKKKPIEQPVVVINGLLFHIDLKKYPHYIQWIAECPSTILFDQDSFDYKAQKIGENYMITSDYNAGCVSVSPYSDFYSWLEMQNK